MNNIKKSLCTLGLLCLGAATLAHGGTKGLVHCGGLFLLNSETSQANGTGCIATDTVQFGTHSVFAGIGYDRINVKWIDSWTLSIKRSAFLGSAGFKSDFRNISLSVSASSEPSITSNLTIHTADSSLYAGTLFGRGFPTLATLRWESENETDEVHKIEADWESDYLRKGFVIGAQAKRHHIQTSLEQISTTPVKQNEEYFIKDSSQVSIWNSLYKYSLDNSAIDLQYMLLSAKSEIIGNSYRDNSTKRFMYLPLKAIMHYADIHWGNESFGIDAKGVLAYGKMKRNDQRFFETLAPNRLLPASVTQALSFSFLQRNYRVNADLNVAAASFGGYASPHFNIVGNARVAPKIGLYGYYTYNDLEIENVSETTSLIKYRRDSEWRLWTLESTGLIANIGLILEKLSQDKLHGLSLEWSAAQIIPLKADIRKTTDYRSSGNSTKVTPEGTRSFEFFKDGFASNLAISISF